MPNVLVLSGNDVFKADLINQIKDHAKEFKLCDEAEKPDVVVIDNDNKQAEIWKNKKIPIIYLTGKDSDNVFSGGQVLMKPLGLGSFLDALRAATSLFENSDSGCLEFGGYVLYPSKKEVVNHKTENVYKLTEKEVAIIKYLYKNSDSYVSKQDLLKEVWGYADDATTHTVETHIYRLRQKIENGNEQFIETSDGGYKLLI